MPPNSLPGLPTDIGTMCGAAKGSRASASCSADSGSHLLKHLNRSTYAILCSDALAER